MMNRLKKYFSKRTTDRPSDAPALQEHCHTAWNYLKKNQRRFRKRPWILLLGTAQSGKTSLLRDIKDPVTSPHNTGLNPAQPTQSVDWWVNQDAVFIDPADQKPPQWQALSKILSHYQPKRPIHHIILTIDLADLTQTPENLLTQLNKKLKAAQQLSTTIPVSIVLSKCDQLPGFIETFSDLDKAGRQQAFGLSFTKEDDNHPVTALQTGFAQLANTLNARLIKRLHQEQNITKRHAIQAFPQAFSQLEKPLENCLTALPFSDTMPLQGIYFTSIREQAVDTYFIESMIDNTIQSAKQPSREILKKASSRLLALPIAATLILTLTLLWHMGFQKTLKIINDIQQPSITLSSHTPNNMPWLIPLNYLGNMINQIDKDNLTRYRWLGLPQADQLSKISHTTYQSLLQSQFLSYTQSTVLTQIQLGMKANQLALFDALKTYLSASSQQYYHKDIIMNWYLTYWKASHPKDFILQSNLQHHLFSLLSSNKPLWTADMTLVKKAQSVLQKLPLADLAFLELQGEYDTSTTSIFPNGQLDGVSLKHATIPTFFSSIHFKAIFNEKIPKIGTILANGSWVLGTNTGKKVSKIQSIQIEKQLRKMYLQYYSQVWNSSLANIQIAPSPDYAAILQRIKIMTNPNASLFQLLKLVKGNATLDTSTHSEALTAIEHYLNQTKDYKKIQLALTQLSQLIDTINRSDQTDKASYDMAVQRFKNHQQDAISTVLKLAARQTQPIQSWLNTIATDSWKIMVNHAHNYLNQVWQSVVVPVYQNEIEHRYPIFSDSREDISLKNFNDFFGPNGTIGAFFINYLQPFVNLSQNYWTLKNRNGVSLNIPQSALNTFIRASIIQQMFFTDNRQTPSFQFIIKAQHLSPSIKHISINMGGQIYKTYRHKHYPSKKFYWPGPDASFTSTQFLTTQGQSTTMTYHGPWSWLRLLQASTLQNAGDPRFFTMIVPLGKNAANIQLIADHRVNPIVPGIINKYRCPNHL
jgi:type VI protein secretion system component VasK